MLSLIRVAVAVMPLHSNRPLTQTIADRGQVHAGWCVYGPSLLLKAKSGIVLRREYGFL